MQTNTMKKTIGKIVISLLVLVGGSTAPLIPSDLELRYSYQYPASSYTQKITDPETFLVKENPQPEFTDDDANDLISVSVFTDKKGNVVYQQIDDAVYSQMGTHDGYKKNPKKSELQSLLNKMTPIAEGAIAFDATGTWTSGSSVTSITFAHTIGAGSNMMLAVLSLSTNNDVSATYNAVPMTKVLVQGNSGADNRFLSMFLLPAPTVGTNNIVITAAVSAAVLQGGGSSYSGAKQTTTLDNSVASSTTASVTAITTSLTPVADNAWIIYGARINAGNAGYTAGANTTRRTFSNNTGLNDTNGAITPPTSTTMSITISNGSSGAYAVMISLAPDVPVTAPLNTPGLLIFQ